MGLQAVKGNYNDWDAIYVAMFNFVARVYKDSVLNCPHT